MIGIVLAAALAFAGAEQPAAKPQSPQGAEFTALAAQAERARKENRPEAAGLYARALKLKPAWKDGWWTLGTIHYEKDRYGECRDAFERLAALDPKSGPALTMLGLCEFGTKQYDRSLVHLRLGQEAGPGPEGIDRVAKYQLAKLLTKSGDFEQSMAILSALAQSAPESGGYVMLSGLAALWKPLFPDEVPANDRELIYLAGKAFWDAAARRAAEAKKGFEALAAKYPASPGVHYLVGSARLSEDPDQAVAEFRQELTISPKHAGALTALAAEYLRRGDAAAALPYARQCVEVLPNSMPSHALLGRALAETGDLDAGIRELETARNFDPNDPQPRIALASAYAKSGRHEDAARERREFLRLKESAAAGAR